MAVRACATASSSSASASGRIVTVPHCGFQTFGGIGHVKCADRARRAFQRMRQRAGIGGQDGQRADQADGLGREHRQHLALEAGIAKRHALEMLDIDRTVIGSERRRWHPVNPFQMKRHGDNPNSLPHRSDGGVLRQPNTPVVNGTFCLPNVSPPQVRLVFGEESPNWSTREKILWTGKTLRRRAVNDD